MKRNIKRIHNAQRRICRLATAFVEENDNETPRLWVGKKLFDLQVSLGKATQALQELKDKKLSNEHTNSK